MKPDVFQAPPRPGVLNLVTLASFLLSGANVLWLFGIGLVMVMAGGLSWFGGPIAGLLGTSIVAVILLALALQFCLSLLLFAAAWQTAAGHRKGAVLHKRWAWITVVLDLFDLIFTWGLDPGAWIRLGYAVFLILVLDKPEVRAYLERDRQAGLPRSASLG